MARVYRLVLRFEPHGTGPGDGGISREVVVPDGESVDAYAKPLIGTRHPHFPWLVCVSVFATLVRHEPENTSR